MRPRLSTRLRLSFFIAPPNGLKSFWYCLVDEDVAVGEEEDALGGLVLPKPPDDLERGVGLARAGGHHKSRRFWPRAMASTVRLMASCW